MVDDEQARRIMAEAIEIARVFEIARKRRLTSGLTGTKIGILKHLKCADARLTELAETLTVSLPVASRAVGALESEGYVVRRSDPADARASLLSLSPAGIDYLRTRESQFMAHFATRLADWSDEDAAQAEAVLSRLRAPLLAAFEPLPEQQATAPTA
ncbi:MarR family winged helix-turn-helix transcriptional regulator [Gordonia hydrophobica]|uniref:MarR family transcriptional regulator n=1 Tax=Gordonia hydrophobica TaxID=40516 RepID=A0ABZ2U166_9ACTN|nr:MarR family transcriptional regulator [Gordonia hydrophobica]MBM7366963.1 DNA-binding MarR family transcriptional regulator [Gordonia hydrophobica]